MDILNADWSGEEREVVKNLAVAKGMSPMAVVRQALRLYQHTDKRLADGETCTWSGDEARRRAFYDPT